MRGYEVKVKKHIRVCVCVFFYSGNIITMLGGALFFKKDTAIPPIESTYFKSKHAKAPISDIKYNLDQMHTEKMDYFKNKPTIIKTKSKQLEEFLREFLETTVNNIQDPEYTIEMYENTKDVKTNKLVYKIRQLQKEIAELKSKDVNEEMIDYYFKTGDFIKKYYESDIPLPSTEKLQIEPRNTCFEPKVMIPTEGLLKSDCIVVNSVKSTKARGLEANGKTEDREDREDGEDWEEEEEEDSDCNSGKPQQQQKVKNKNIKDITVIKTIDSNAQLVNQYLDALGINKETNGVHTKAKRYTFQYECEMCDGTEMVKNLLYLTCTECGNTTVDVCSNEYAPSYKELQERYRSYNLPVFAYQKINHFNEHIANMQAEGNSDIPQEYMTAIENEIKKCKINVKTLEEKKLRVILKKLKLNHFYEHAQSIIYLLNKIPPLKMEPALQEQLRTMFGEIQAPFYKYCPKDRKNFLNYRFVLYKFCQLLNRDEYLRYFPLLKSRVKLYQQDQIWKGICSELLWEFIPSV